jgi:hypothetical protein
MLTLNEVMKINNVKNEYTELYQNVLILRYLIKYVKLMKIISLYILPRCIYPKCTLAFIKVDLYFKIRFSQQRITS